ncbi:MAG: hypothetical protein ACI853_000352, partial [Paracoccaceae bacterium]
CLPTVFQAVEVLDTRTNTLEAYCGCPQPD